MTGIPLMPAPALSEPPAGRITLWQGEDGRWLALLTYNTLQTCVVRDTREKARADCITFWREHTKEGRTMLSHTKEGREQ